MTLAQAQALYQQVLALKQSYETIAAQSPGVVQGVGTTGQALQSITDQASALRAQLAAGGYAEAADILSADDYADALAWAQANPSLGVAQQTAGGTGVQLSYGGSPAGGSGSAGGSASGAGSGSGSTAGSSGVLGSAMGFLTGLLGDLNGFVQTLLNPGQWFASLGQGIGSGEQAVGAGFSGGATSASSGVGTLWQALAWPAVILAGLYAVDRIAKASARRGR